ALGVREQPGRPLTATLLDYLQQREMLLVLDNCEHLIAACSQLTEALLHSCPNLRILATSREAFNIAGEISWLVPSLSSPNPATFRHLPSVQHLKQYEAICLFLERAAVAFPAFTLTNENAAAVVQICHHLDGMPLAIELAAARVKVLAVEQIAARLAQRFQLLSEGSRTALPRQQTLQ